jgi:thiol-disulfide isomerase/thioredoxin
VLADRLILSLLIIAAGLGAYAVWQRWTLRRASALAAASGKPVILYFRSDSCAPCTVQWRFLEQIQTEFGDTVTIEKIDADVEQAKSARYGVFTVPTTLIVDPDGSVRHANYGLTHPRKLTVQLRDVFTDGAGI